MFFRYISFHIFFRYIYFIIYFSELCGQVDFDKYIHACISFIHMINYSYDKLYLTPNFNDYPLFPRGILSRGLFHNGTFPAHTKEKGRVILTRRRVSF